MRKYNLVCKQNKVSAKWEPQDRLCPMWMCAVCTSIVQYAEQSEVSGAREGALVCAKTYAMEKERDDGGGKSINYTRVGEAALKL